MYIYFSVGSFNGALSSLPAHELGSLVVREALNRVNVSSQDVSEVILGQVLTAGQLIVHVLNCII